MEFRYRIKVKVNRVPEDQEEFIGEDIRLQFEDAELEEVEDENGRRYPIADWSVELEDSE